MQIYLSRNNQQAGPFEEAKVLEMLRNGQVSPNDFGIRQGKGQWKTLSEMFRISASPSVNSGVQNIMSWAKQNLPNQLFVQHKSVSSELKSYLLTLIIVGVLPFLAGIILKIIISPALGSLSMLIGGILFVTLLLMFALIFLVNHFRKKKFAAIFNSQGVVTNNNVIYEWDKLQYINFLRIQNPGLRGHGLLPRLIMKLAVVLIRRAIFNDPRQRLLDGAELIFANGKVILPTTMTNFAEIWDFIEKIPAQPRFEGRFDQNTMAELQSRSLYVNRQNTSGNSANPQMPNADKKPNSALLIAGMLIGGLLLLGVGGIFAAYLFIYSLSAVNAAPNGKGNSNSSQISSNGTQTFLDPSPDKKPDFTMTAEEFHIEAGDYSKTNQALAKYKNKVIVISGRVNLFTPFDGKDLHFKVPKVFLRTRLLTNEKDKLQNIKAGERVTVKCEVADNQGLVDVKNCAVLERKPAVTADEKPDFSITAKEFYDQVENLNQNDKTRLKNREKYIGKIIEVSGKVKVIGGEKHFLSVGNDEKLTCLPDDDNKEMFAKLTEGQEVKFRGVDDGIYLKHCIVSK